MDTEPARRNIFIKIITVQCRTFIPSHITADAVTGIGGGAGCTLPPLILGLEGRINLQTDLLVFYNQPEHFSKKSDTTSFLLTVPWKNFS